MSDYPSELRHDRLSDRWVLVAAGRSKRPHEFAPPKAGKHRDPFDPKNVPADDITEKVANDTPDAFSHKADWKVMAIKNAFPFVAPGDDPQVTGRRRDGYGFHEIIIHSPDQDKDFQDFSLEQSAAVLGLMQRRLLWMADQPHIEHVQIFTNHGHEAGASVVHPHSQIVALPLVPPYVERIVHAAATHYQAHDESLIDHLIERETREGDRVIAENKDFLAYCPYASRAEYHTRIVPKTSGQFFRDIKASELKALAEILTTIYAKMSKLGVPAYNAHIRTAPVKDMELDGFRWYVDVLPHLSTPGGLELSTGLYVITVSPEDAAKALREA